MESTVIIERPVEEVFGFVSDLTNIPWTDPSVRSVEKTSEGPIEAGTTFLMRQEAPPLGKVREATVRYTAVEPDRNIEFEALVGPITPTARLTFEQANGGTKVTFRGEPNPVGGRAVADHHSSDQPPGAAYVGQEAGSTQEHLGGSGRSPAPRRGGTTRGCEVRERCTGGWLSGVGGTHLRDLSIFAAQWCKKEALLKRLSHA
jgi:uncharacterized protein YndB with AHSA1/START domain